MLPEDCVSIILSLTSPLDACRSSVVSSIFSSASSSDLVWDQFLPSDHHDLITRLVKVNDDKISLKLFTKKELFFHLCKPVLIDDGTKSFKIEKSTGKKSYILSARELHITWSDETMYWSWKHVTQSRFAEVVELRTISWLEIHGKIRTRTLSKNTTYVAYLVMNISNRAYGLETTPFEVSIHIENRKVSNGMVNVCEKDHVKSQKMNVDSYEALRPKVLLGNEEFISTEIRDDGWLEIKLGEFFVSQVDEEVTMSFTEIKGYHLKAGLVIEGIEVRPKNLTSLK